MNIDAVKTDLIQRILNNNDEKALLRISEYVKNSEADFYTLLSDDAKKSIQIGLKQLEAGERVPIEEALDRLRCKY